MKHVIPILLLSLIVASCSPTKNTPRNDRRVSAWMMANPGPSGSKCHRMFPETDSSSTKTYFKPGVPETIIDNDYEIDPEEYFGPWLQFMGDSLRAAILDSFAGHPVKAKCPPSTKTVDTVYKDNYVRVVDRKKEAVLSDSLNSLAKQLSDNKVELKGEKSKTDTQRGWKQFWMWAFIIVGAYQLLRLIIKAQWPGFGKILP